jgi:ATP-dependent Zn protease
LLYAFLLVAVVALFFTAFPQTGGDDGQQISITQVAAGVKDGKIRQIRASDTSLQIVFADRSQASSRKDSGEGLTQQLRDYGVTPEQLANVNVVISTPPAFTNWLGLLVNLLPLVFFGGILLLMLRRLSSPRPH